MRYREKLKTLSISLNHRRQYMVGGLLEMWKSFVSEDAEGNDRDATDFEVDDSDVDCSDMGHNSVGDDRDRVKPFTGVRLMNVAQRVCGMGQSD